MSDIVTKVNISLGDCVLEFSGSEAFVQKQIDEFKDLVHGKLKSVKVEKSNSLPPVEDTDEDDEKPDDVLFATYPNIIDYNEGTINILKVDGKKKADKTRNLVLMYAWAKKQMGILEIPKKELVELCKHHECFDEGNFKTTLKAASGIIVKGSPQKYTVRLTAPGETKAKGIVETHNKQES